ncbi:uncharacterized protein LOC123317019 [Coccinella septempunctata]|uniref:uncharacterized protein LOC123317019 n=1 Tax=Coccinella septempunctata TaxID=41139 RepID=UPI001D08ABBA|nr:uncharacterized protein LOC123317019 [Coccinella septempunctata]
MSDIKMNINHLLKDELQHELCVRGLSFSETATVETLRSCLRSTLKLETMNQSFKYPDYNFDVSNELTTVNIKLEELRKSLAIGKVSRDNIRSRSLHLVRRLDRIPEDKLDGEKDKTKRQTLSEILLLLDSVEAVPTKSEALHAELAGLLLSADEQSSDSSSDHLDFEIPRTNKISSTPERTQYFKKCDIQKWNLKFSGDSKGMSVNNFLERVEELRVARGVAESRLFESAIDLFDGKALLWYRSNRGRFSSWKDLTDLLLKHYQPPDYKARLFKDILSRTQDSSEGIIEYVSCMRGMFRRYGDVAEDIQLNIIVRNLSPFYSTQLSSVTNLQ